MAQVPTLDNFRLLPNNNPSMRFNTDIRLDANDQNIKALGRLAELGVAIYNKKQDEEADDAINKYLDGLENSGREYSQKLNNDAINDVDGNDVWQQTDASRADLRTSLTKDMDGRQLARFNKGVAAAERRWNAATLGHRYQQEMAVADTRTSALQDKNWRLGIDAIADGKVEDFEEFRARNEELFREKLLRYGYADKNAQDFLLGKENQQMMVSTYELVKERDPEKALAFVEHYKDYFPSDVYAKITNEAVELSDYSSASQALAKIRETKTYAVGGGGANDVVVTDGRTGLAALGFGATRAESGNNWKKKNDKSTAAGKFQILDDTARRAVEKRGLVYNPDDRFDPVKGQKIAEYVADDMVSEMKKKTGRKSFTAGEMYLAWFLGPAGFAKMSKAKDGDLAINHLAGDKRQQGLIKEWNKPYLYKKDKAGEYAIPRTVGELKSLIAGKAGMGGKSKMVPANFSNVTDASAIVSAVKKMDPGRYASMGAMRALAEFANETAAENRMRIHNEDARQGNALMAGRRAGQEASIGREASFMQLPADLQAAYSKYSNMDADEYGRQVGWLFAHEGLKDFSSQQMAAYAGGGNSPLGRILYNYAAVQSKNGNAYDPRLSKFTPKKEDIDYVVRLMGLANIPQSQWQDYHKFAMGQLIWDTVKAYYMAGKNDAKYESFQHAANAIARSNLSMYRRSFSRIFDTAINVPDDYVYERRPGG